MGVYYPCGVRRLRARLRRGRPRRGALCPPDRPLWSPGPPPRAAPQGRQGVRSRNHFPPGRELPQNRAPGRGSRGRREPGSAPRGRQGVRSRNHFPPGRELPQNRAPGRGSGPSGGPRSAPGSLLGALPRDFGPGRALWGLLGPHTGAGAARPADPRPMRLA